MTLGGFLDRLGGKTKKRWVTDDAHGAGAGAIIPAEEEGPCGPHLQGAGGFGNQRDASLEGFLPS